MSLTELKSGQKALIIEILGGFPIKRKIESLGLRVGSYVINLGNDFLKGPLIVQSGCTQIAIGHGMAKKIIVEPQ